VSISLESILLVEGSKLARIAQASIEQASSELESI
jgi:hypothetical protein